MQINRTGPRRLRCTYAHHMKAKDTTRTNQSWQLNSRTRHSSSRRPKRRRNLVYIGCLTENDRSRSTLIVKLVLGSPRSTSRRLHGHAGSTKVTYHNAPYRNPAQANSRKPRSVARTTPQNDQSALHLGNDCPGIRAKY